MNVMERRKINTINSKRSLLSFGAIADGNTESPTDNYDMLVEAFSSPYSITIPKGVFYCSKKLPIITIEKTIEGEGEESVILMDKSIGKTSSIEIGGSGVRLLNFKVKTTQEFIQRPYFDEPDNAYDNWSAIRAVTPIGIGVYKATNFLIFNVTAEHTNVGIEVISSNNGTIMCCNIRETFADGIHIWGDSYDITEMGNKAYKTMDDCFSVVGYNNELNVFPRRIKIVANSARDCFGRGLVFAGCHGCIGLSNVFENTMNGFIGIRGPGADSAFDIGDVWDITISNNYWECTGKLSDTYVSSINNATDSTVSENKIIYHNEDIYSRSFQITKATRVDILNNKFDGFRVTVAGVSSDLVIDNNKFYNPNGTPLYINTCNFSHITNNRFYTPNEVTEQESAGEFNIWLEGSYECKVGSNKDFAEREFDVKINDCHHLRMENQEKTIFTGENSNISYSGKTMDLGMSGDISLSLLNATTTADEVNSAIATDGKYTRKVNLKLFTSRNEFHAWYIGTMNVEVSKSSASGNVIIAGGATSATFKGGLAAVTLEYTGTWEAGDTITLTAHGGNVLGYTIGDKTSVHTLT